MSATINGPLCIFDCPRGVGTSQGKCSADTLPQPGATWKNEGTDDKPTLNPSFHCVNGCGWHGYIVDGEAIDTPVIAGAAASVATIHVCEECRKPEIFVVGLTPQPEGGLDVQFVIVDPRKPPTLPIEDSTL